MQKNDSLGSEFHASHIMVDEPREHLEEGDPMYSQVIGIKG